MEGQKRLLRRLSVRGVESDKPSVCIGRITTQFLHAVQQKNPQSSTAEIDKSKLGWALDVAQRAYRKLEVHRSNQLFPFDSGRLICVEACAARHAVPLRQGPVARVFRPGGFSPATPPASG